VLPLPPLPPLLPLLSLPSVPHLVTHLLRSLVPPLLVAPQTWSGQECYGPRRYTRGEDRRFAGPQPVRREFYGPRSQTRGEARGFARPDQGRHNDRHVDRRGYSGYGDRRR